MSESKTEQYPVPTQNSSKYGTNEAQRQAEAKYVPTTISTHEVEVGVAPKK